MRLESQYQTQHSDTQPKKRVFKCSQQSVTLRFRFSGRLQQEGEGHLHTRSTHRATEIPTEPHPSKQTKYHPSQAIRETLSNRSLHTVLHCL